MTDITNHDQDRPGAIGNVDNLTEHRSVQITVNGVTLTVQNEIKVQDLLAKARNASAIEGSIEDYYITNVEEKGEFHIGGSVEVTNATRYLAVPKGPTNVA